MPLPIVAIVGRVNVGKSTLFNRLVGHRVAVVEDFPGVTRDRLYARGELVNRPVMFIDTGGMVGAEGDPLISEVNDQAVEALREADVLVVLVDGREGITAHDHEIAQIVRRSGKPHVLAANKMERPSSDSYDFYALRLGEPIDISAEQGFGVVDLEDEILDLLPPEEEEEERREGEIAIAVVGRPNAGKSALINAILGQKRLIVNEMPGTTRDAVDTWAQYEGRPIRIVDTAGLRRKGKRSQGTEFFSSLRTLRALERADIALVVVDSTEGMTAQDARVALEAHDMGRAVIVVCNKWDLVLNTAFPDDEEEPLTEAQRKRHLKLIWDDFQRLARHELPFLAYAPLLKTCALTGEGVEQILPLCREVFDQYDRRIETGQLNRCIRRAVANHQPPSKAGRPLRILYATQVSTRPPTIVVFVSDAKIMHFSYERYLLNSIREEFGFEGTPLKLIVRGRKEKDE
jgi:GTP-binding protein